MIERFFYFVTFMTLIKLYFSSMKSSIYLFSLLITLIGCTNPDDKTSAKKDLQRKDLTKTQKYFSDQLKKIETSTTYLIYDIDRLKISLLKDANEKHPSEDLTPSIKPFRYDLGKLKNPNNQEAANHIFIAKDENNPSKSATRLFDDLRIYRRVLMSIAASTENHPIILEEFNDYNSDEELQKLVEKDLTSKNIPSQKDKQLLIRLYKTISWPDYKTDNGKKEHWMVYSFQDWDITIAFSTLTSLQTEILTARALALDILKSDIPGRK